MGSRLTLSGAVKRLQTFQLWISGFSLMAMMLMTTMDVILRYLANRPIRGAYDFVQAMLVLFVFNGLSSAFLRRGHIVIDVLDGFFGPRIKKILVTLFDFVTVIALLGIAYAMYVQALQAFDYGDRMLELDIPVWYIWVVGLSGLAGVIICAVHVLANSGSKDRRIEP